MGGVLICLSIRALSAVMAGLVPAIHVLLAEVP
jgi:hypothetical protein